MPASIVTEADFAAMDEFFEIDLTSLAFDEIPDNHVRKRNRMPLHGGFRGD
jgi:hypothetical protein